MKKLLFYILLVQLSIMSAREDYTISFLGIVWVYVTMDKPQPGQLDFGTRTTGLIDLIWPVDNKYNTDYDTVAFGVNSFEKNIRQGSFRQKLNLKVNRSSGLFTYDGKTEVKRPSDTQTIYTMLARVGEQDPDQLDGRWFPMEHEGKPFEFRLLWAGEDDINIGRKTYSCDHYRLDIRAAAGQKTKIVNQTDYFSEYIIHPDAVRQLWVETSGSRRIIMASVKLFGFNLEARLEDE